MIKFVKSRLIHLVLLYALVSTTVHGQQKLLNFFHLDYEYGLSDNHVNAMAMDRDGFLWVGTPTGLNQFDGYNFKIFKHIPGDSTSIPDNQISSLLVTSRGDLYVGTLYGGVCKYNSLHKNFEFITYNPERTIIRETIVQDIKEDKDHNIWINTNKGLYFSENGTAPFQWFCLGDDQQPNDKYPFLLGNDISGLTCDPDGGIWISFDSQGLVYYNPGTRTLHVYKWKDYFQGYREMVVNKLFAEKGQLWIGTDKNGTFRFPLKSKKPEQFLFENGGYSVHDIYKDSKGLYWICTNEGLISLNMNNKKFTKFVYESGKPNCLSASAVKCILEDKEGIIWVGVTMGGINYTQPNKPFDHLSYSNNQTKFSLSFPIVTSVLSDSKGKLWVGYDVGDVDCFDFTLGEKSHNRTISFNSKIPYAGTVTSLFEDSHGGIWLTAWQGGLQKFNPHTGKFEIFKNPITGKPLIDWADIRDIAEDQEGNLWMCRHGRGIVIADPATWKLSYYDQNTPDNKDISGNWTFDICVDRNNRKWIATSWGITRVSADNSVFKTYRNRHNDPTSLIHNSVNTIFCDSKGRIWIGTAEGLNLYNEPADKFIRFRNGNSELTDNIKAIAEDDQGNIWFSTNTGIEKIQLEDTAQKPPTHYKIRLYNYADGLQSVDYLAKAITKNHSGELFFGGSKGIDFFLPKDIVDYRFHPKMCITGLYVHNSLFAADSTQARIIDGMKHTVLQYKQNYLTMEYIALDYIYSEKVNYRYKLEGLDTAWVDAGNNRSAVFTNLKPGIYTFRVMAVGPNNEYSAQAVYRFYIKPPFWDTLPFKLLMVLLVIMGIVFFTNMRIAFFKRRKKELEQTVAIRTEEVQIKNAELQKQTENLNEINTVLEEKQQHIQEQAEELHAQAEELKRTNEELNLINNTKDKLFSIIAHDLKNPFNIILGFSDLLLSDFDKRKVEDNRKMAGLIKESAVSAYQLLENLLYWSQSQRNKLNAQMELFDLNIILEEISSLLKEQILRKEIDYEFYVDKDTQVYADYNMINTVLRNLLANAIKFTPKNGSIRIKAENEGDYVKISVSDTGIGIGMEKLANLFQIESTGSEKGTEGEQGTGLGLVISKEFVENNGGKIWVESKPRKGSVFFFTIPRHKS